MSRKKSLFEYIFMALMIMCLGLALSASLEYVTRATEREFLNQGRWVLSMAALSLVLFFGVRLWNRLGQKFPEGVKTALSLGLCAVAFAAGLLLRLWVIHAIPIEPESDFETYYRIANHLLNDTLLTPEGAADRRYISLYPHTIGYPMMVLLPVFRIFGASVNAALYANLVCSMLAVVLAGHIGYRLHGRLGMVCVTVLTSLWPSHIFYSNMVATEPAFTLLLLLAADIMLSVLDRKDNSLFVRAPGRMLALLCLLGIVLAVAGAIRPMALILLAAFAAVQLGMGKEGVEKHDGSGMQNAVSRGILCLVLTLVFYFGTGAIITKTISDTIMDEPVGGLSASGYNLMVGVNSKSLGLWNQEDADFFTAAYETTGSAAEAHKACMDKALERISAEPENTLDLLIYKFRDLWQTDDFGIDWNLLWTGQQGTLTPEMSQMFESWRPVGRTAYMMLLLLCLIAVLDTWRKTRAPHPMMMVCILFFLGTALAHMLLETQVRYHYNMLPFLILLGSFALAGWRERMQEEPPVRLVEIERDSKEMPDDHTHFDMGSAILNGNIRVSVTKKYQDEAIEAAAAKQAEEAARAAAAETPAPEAPAETVEEPEPVPEETASFRDAGGSAEGGEEAAPFRLEENASAEDAEPAAVAETSEAAAEAEAAAPAAQDEPTEQVKNQEEQA